MKLSDFDYHLPRALIAQQPAEPRDSSRLMVIGESIEHRRFYELVEYLQEGDVLVLNDTRVIPARLTGCKPTGGRVRALLLQEVERDTLWECFLQGKNIRPGLRLFFNGTKAQVLERTPEGRWLVRFKASARRLMEQVGEMPLPPYIKQELEDSSRYQTVYAARQGSIAAPTAGLHFTEQLLEKIRNMGVVLTTITLHVGAGTFLPVRTEDVSRHRMHEEYVTVSQQSADEINNRSGRLIVVGTTTLRALEAASQRGTVHSYEGWCDLFIHPPYAFQSPAEALVTNFHLPRSTLLMMVSAFAGRETILNAYRVAVEQGYRFYSFGDAMLIFRRHRDVRADM